MHTHMHTYLHTHIQMYVCVDEWMERSRGVFRGPGLTGRVPPSRGQATLAGLGPTVRASLASPAHYVKKTLGAWCLKMKQLKESTTDTHLRSTTRLALTWCGVFWTSGNVDRHFQKEPHTQVAAQPKRRANKMAQWRASTNAHQAKRSTDRTRFPPRSSAAQTYPNSCPQKLVPR